MTTLRRLRALGWALLLTGLACGGSPAEEPPPVAAPLPAVPEVAEVAEHALALGPGFVVWESNRSGVWRLWLRRLDGSPPRQLTRDEAGRDHCCPHISPDGERIAYLSAAAGVSEYPPGGLAGELRLISPSGDGERVVARRARNYFENRAVVWRSPDELIHIDGERATVVLDLLSGRSRRLAPPPAEHGWLIDAGLRWATTGVPTFSPYDAAARTVAPRRRLGGCQPYFSPDGRWGIWTAGVGGPIDRIELASRKVARILDKNDRRVPGGWGYAYFPMLSADGRLFAWAASRGGHDHFTADYEVFVAESDPDTLELVGPPLRISRDPGTDRFPDVWQPPLALGRHAGEAPYSVLLEAPAAGDWRWSLGDGSGGRGPAVEHRWSEPGRYEVEARLERRSLRGLVVVREPHPPRVTEATALAGGTEVVVRFDEPVETDGATVTLASGRPHADLEPGADGSSLLLRLREPLRGPQEVTVAGVRDRAQRANEMPPARLVIEPPAWPARRDGLRFVWETADAANLVPDPALGADRSYTLTAGGEARLDAHFAMVVDGGSFTLEPGEAGRLVEALQATNQLTLEATVTPLGGAGPIVAAAGGRNRNLWLRQGDGGLAVGLRTGRRGRDSFPQVDLFELPRGRPSHLVVAYEPGRLTAYLDGRLQVDSDAAQGDFYHWRALPLVFGGGGWQGRIEGVALYDRVLTAAEVAESHRLYRAKLEARRPIPRSVVEARLLDRSRTPTLKEISPYREALATVRYAVERQLEGPPVGGEVRAAQWVILDGRTLALDRAAAGARYRLTLEPYARQRQLEAVYLSDTGAAAAADPSGELFYVVAAAPAG